MCRDRCRGQHAAETPLHDCPSVWVLKNRLVPNVKKVLIAPPLDHVQVAAVRTAWHESSPLLRAPRGGDATTCLYCCTGTPKLPCPECITGFNSSTSRSRACCCCACGSGRVVTVAAGTTRRRRHSMIVLLYVYPNITSSGMYKGFHVSTSRSRDFCCRACGLA